MLPPRGQRPTGHPPGWEGNEVTLFHEPVLLETGGGLKNIAAWIGHEPLLVHNGDIFSTLPLEKLIAAHQASGLPVTLALRSAGPRQAHRARPLAHPCHRHPPPPRAGRGHPCLFRNLLHEPGFLDLLPAHEKISVIPAFLTLAEQGRLGAVVLDEGAWLDLGDRESYLLAHRQLKLAPAIHPLAIIAAGATVENSIIGPGSVVAAGAMVRDSVVWPGSRIAGDAVLDECIVCSGQLTGGTHRHEDL